MEYKIQIYSLDVADSAFSLVAETESYEQLQFVQKLNGVGVGEFEMLLEDDVFSYWSYSRFRQQVAIIRDGVCIFFGPITNIAEIIEPESQRVRFEFQDYLHHLMYRYTDNDYFIEDTEASTAYSNLISDVQSRANGELLITSGTLQTIGNVDITSENEPVAELLMRKSDNQISFDFDLSPTQDGNGRITGVKFNMYKAKGSFRSNFPKLSFDTNIQSFERYTNEDIYNSITGLGSGTGQLIPSDTQNNSGSQTGYTRREFVYKDSQAKTISEINNKSVRLLNTSSGERRDVDIEFMPGAIKYGDVSLGDTVKLEFEKNNTPISYSSIRRVKELYVQITQTNEIITPVFEDYG